jgi:hypothetical protein
MRELPSFRLAGLSIEPIILGMFRGFKTRLTAALPKPRAQQRGNVAPEGEVETLLKVKQLCALAKMSAERMAEWFANGAPNHQMLMDETRQYRFHLKRGFDLARAISDRYYHDYALRFLIDVTMMARDEEYAKLLFRAVESHMTRKAILKDHPSLRSSPNDVDRPEAGWLFKK